MRSTCTPDATSFAAWTPDLIAAVAGLLTKGPANLLKRVNIDRDDVDQVTVDDLQALVDAHTQHDDAGVRQLALALAEWDFAKDPMWDAAQPTSPRTVERRNRVYTLL